MSDSSLVRRDFAMMVAGALARLAIVGVSVWLVARTNEHSGEVARALELRTSTARLPARCLRTSLNYDMRDAGGTRGARSSPSRRAPPPGARCRPRSARA